ncbi:MAG TPA: ABC transporter permease [Oscillatoriaceae cyanobacterium]
MFAEPAAPRAGSGNFPGGAIAYAREAFAIAEVELRKLRRDPTELVTRSVQPALWLMVFGQVFGRLRGIPTGGLSYLAFMSPGILAQSVLFIAIFYGIVVIWERDLGLLQKQLVTPAARSALVLGKGVSAGIRGLAQALIIYLLTILLGVPLSLAPLNVLGVLAMVLLGSALFSTFSLVIACLMKTRERFMGIGQVLTMPLFFASNAIYPLAMMPDWLRAVASFNPLSYQVDALRALMVRGGASAFGLGADFAVQGVVLVVLVAIAARLYPEVAI